MRYFTLNVQERASLIILKNLCSRHNLNFSITRNAISYSYKNGDNRIIHYIDDKELNDESECSEDNESETDNESDTNSEDDELREPTLTEQNVVNYKKRVRFNLINEVETDEDEVNIPNQSKKKRKIEHKDNIDMEIDINGGETVLDENGNDKNRDDEFRIENNDEDLDFNEFIDFDGEVIVVTNENTDKHDDENENRGDEVDGNKEREQDGEIGIENNDEDVEIGVTSENTDKHDDVNGNENNDKHENGIENNDKYNFENRGDEVDGNKERENNDEDVEIGVTSENTDKHDDVNGNENNDNHENGIENNDKYNFENWGDEVDGNKDREQDGVIGILNNDVDVGLGVINENTDNHDDVNGNENNDKHDDENGKVVVDNNDHDDNGNGAKRDYAEFLKGKLLSFNLDKISIPLYILYPNGDLVEEKTLEEVLCNCLLLEANFKRANYSALVNNFRVGLLLYKIRCIILKERPHISLKTLTEAIVKGSGIGNLFTNNSLFDRKAKLDAYRFYRINLRIYQLFSGFFDPLKFILLSANFIYADNIYRMNEEKFNDLVASIKLESKLVYTYHFDYDEDTYFPEINHLISKELLDRINCHINNRQLDIYGKSCYSGFAKVSGLI